MRAASQPGRRWPGRGLSWGRLSAHLSWQRAAVPAAEAPSAVAPCTWQALLGAVHGCSISRRTTSGGRSRARDWPRRPSPSPPRSPPRPVSQGARAVSLRGEPWRPSGTPTFLIRIDSEPGAGGGSRRWGGSPGRRRPGAQTRPQPPWSGRSEPPAALGHFAVTVLRSPGRDLPPQTLPPNSGPSPSQRHGRISATHQV